MKGTPEADDAVRVTKETEPPELRDFAKNRAMHPRVIEVEDKEVTIWNFSTHAIDELALYDVVPNLNREKYVIPYQLPGVWGYFHSILPDEILEAELLVYSMRDEEYKAFPNFGRFSDSEKNKQTREEIKEEL